MGIMPDSPVRESAPNQGMIAPSVAARSCQGVISTAQRAAKTMGQKGVTLARL